MMRSESEIISWIRQRARRDPLVSVGVGDDAAIISTGGAKDLIACSDLVVEGIHFRTEWAKPRWIGLKALTASLSDVAAMGGSPRFALTSIALSAGRPGAFVEQLLEGVFEAADKYDVVIVGGDTSSSPGPLFIDTIVLGECEAGKAVRRSGAAAGDGIFVTGALGAAAFGLRLLHRGYRLEEESAGTADAKPLREALAKHLVPEPPVKFGRAVGEAGLASAMIDISDGLSTDLGHILEESHCGATLEAKLIPVASCLLSREPDAPDPTALALHSGEEYELLLTCSPKNEPLLLDLARSCGTPITRIGRITTDARLLLHRDGEFAELTRGGFEHKW